MSGLKATPGPWAIDKRRYIMGPGDSGSIARVVEYVGEFREEGEANARLIAAAPELYEALEQLSAVAEMTTFSDQYPAECEQASAALAKARGETA